MNRTNRVVFVLLVVIGVLALTVMFAAGFAVGRVTDLGIPGPNVAEGTLGRKVEEVESLLDRAALVPADEASKTAGAISGLLEGTGDKYAAYFDARHYQYFNEQTDGQFGGIGVTIAERDGQVYFVSIIEDTPAEKVGLRPDDEVREIDGTRRAEWTSEEVVRRVRGEEGTTVELIVYRPADEKELEFTIERAKIDIPNVTSEIKDGDVGYVRMGSFNAQSTEDLRSAFDELRDQGATSFVLDLRDNPGGLLQESVDVASLFIEDGVIVRVDERDKPEREYRTTGGIDAYTATELPLVLLVNENSASASEVLGGALQDYDRATLVGVKTFGKGSVQSIEELSFGGAVKFTTAHYLTPNGRTIDGVGLTPEVVVEMDVEKQADEETDVQLQRALKVAAGL